LRDAAAKRVEANRSDLQPVTNGTDRSDPMSNTMTCKGYAARIEYDDDDRIFAGRIAGIRDGVGSMPIRWTL